MKKKGISVILKSVAMAVYLFFLMSNTVMANVSDLNLRLPFPGGDSWGISCIYQDTDPDCITHAVLKSNGEKNIDEWAIDFNLSEANDCGKSIVAVASGIAKVYLSTSTTGYGNRVDISHGSNDMTRYAHLLSVSVSDGEKVAQGQEIGKAGDTGNVTNCHLHFVWYHDDGNGYWSVKPTPMSGYDEFLGGGARSYTSDNYYTPATYFNFTNGSEGWTTGFDAKNVEQTQSDAETWMVATDNFDGTGGTNPGVISPNFAKGITTDQFRTLKFSARVDGSGANSPGYVYIKDNSGNSGTEWDNEAYFGAVPRDYLYHEYSVDLTQLGANLPISQFSIELTENGGYEYWIFDWIKLISSYYYWNFTDSQLGWTINQHGQFADFYDNIFWRIEPTGKQPQIVSPYLENISSEFIRIGIRYSLTKPCALDDDDCLEQYKNWDETVRVYFDTGNGFSASCYNWQTVTHSGTTKTVIFDMPSCAIGNVQRVMLDLFDNDDYADKLIAINKINFLQSNSSDDPDFIIAGGNDDPPPSDDYTFNSSFITDYVDSNYNPNPEKTIFYNEDDYVYSWMQSDDVYKTLAISWYWHNPSGTLVSSNGLTTDDPADSGYSYWGWYEMWSRIDISSVTNYGQWYVDIYIDGVKVATDYFTITINLNAPTLTAAAVSRSQIDLSWSAVDKANGYRLYRNGTLLTGTANLNHSDTGLSSDTSYCYQITAYRGNATSAYSNQICVTTNPDSPVADFTASATSGYAPLTVQFTDTSTGNITGYSWNFGDGNTSSSQNPEHIYSAAGTYEAALIVVGPGGSNQKTKIGYITVSESAPLSAPTILMINVN